MTIEPPRPWARMCLAACTYQTVPSRLIDRVRRQNSGDICSIGQCSKIPAATTMPCRSPQRSTAASTASITLWASSITIGRACAWPPPAVIFSSSASAWSRLFWKVSDTLAPAAAATGDKDVFAGKRYFWCHCRSPSITNPWRDT